MRGSLCLGEETPALRGRNEINKRDEKRRRKNWWNLDWWRKLFRSYGWTNLAIYKSYWHPNHHSREHKIHFFSLNSKCFEEKKWKSILVQGGGSQKQMCDSLACWITQVAVNGNTETVQHPTSALVNNATVINAKVFRQLKAFLFCIDLLHYKQIKRMLFRILLWVFWITLND